MNPMSLLNQFHRWLGESRRNQFLAAGAALVAGGMLAAVGVGIAVSGDRDPEEQVVAHTATPSPAAEAPTRTPRRTTTSSPTPTPEPVETLAFIREGDIWLINADGSGERRAGMVQEFSWISSRELDVVTSAAPRGHLVMDLVGNVQDLSFPAGGSWTRDGNRYVVPGEQKLVVFEGAQRSSQRRAREYLESQAPTQ